MCLAGIASRPDQDPVNHYLNSFVMQRDLCFVDNAHRNEPGAAQLPLRGRQQATSKPAAPIIYLSARAPVALCHISH